MRSLLEFIECDLNVCLSAPGHGELTLCSSLNGLYELLTSCFVIANSRKIELPQVYADCDHKHVVDQCIVHLIERNLFNNVLTFGYSIGRVDCVTKSLHCIYTNSNVSRIKNPQWNRLHKLIGTYNFVNLLINYTILQFTGSFFMQVVGNRANEPNTPPSWFYQRSQKQDNLHSETAITLRTSFQRKSSIFKGPGMIPAKDSADELIGKIFLPFLDKIQGMRNSQIKPLIKRLTLNHTRIKYFGILDNVCPRSKNKCGYYHLDTKTPVTQVNRFIIILIEKLIPIRMFGSKRNKANLFNFISVLLRLPVGGSIPLSEILNNLRIEDFDWLETNHLVGVQRRDLVAHFIFWFFQRFVLKIISTFFYCTEVSSSVEVLFFRHDVWEAISTPFLGAYFRKYLVHNKVCRNHKSYLLSKFNHSKLRLVPKKASGEFRVLAAPRKGADEEESIAHLSHFKSVTYPVQCILDFIRKKRKTRFNKILSSNEIIGNIKIFRQTLLKKYGFIPELFFMKFDIESCYDSIRREKAMEIIKGLLENEPGFFVRSQAYLNPSTGSLKIQNVVNGSRQPRDDEIYIDNVRTVYLTRQDVLEVLELEFFKTAISFGGKCYLRKDGLFQGSRLSALVVDLVYDDLVESQTIFRARPKYDNLVIRLADDFLVISSDKCQILELERISQVGFPEYGAKIKADKIGIAGSGPLSSVFQFCALEISVTNLNIWKTSNLFNVPDFRFHSPAKIYQKLRYLYEMRLSYGTVDGHMNEPQTILYQLHHIGNNIAKTFANAFNRKPVCTERFDTFLRNIFASTNLACQHCPEDMVFKSQARLTILNSLLEVLNENTSKFTNAIDLLLVEINKCMYILSLV